MVGLTYGKPKAIDLLRGSTCQRADSGHGRVAGLTLDTGALIAYERGEERVREILAVAYARGLVPTIPALALAEVWRGDARTPASHA